MSTDNEILKNKLFRSSKFGMSIVISEMLNDLNEETRNEILHSMCLPLVRVENDHFIHKLLEETSLETYVEEDGEECTPLIISAKNGHEKVIRALLKFKPQLDIEGTVKFDECAVKGATPLWCAAGAGHLSVVKMLVRAGADVNHFTKTNSTPLRAACFDGRLDIVRYLTDHGANINIPNKFNNTCLMMAAYRGYIDIVRFLLELGADPNTRANCGATALHFAAELGHAEIVKELLQSGAKIFKNENKMTPLMSAAEQARVGVVEHFLSLPLVVQQERIDSYELLGATFSCHKDYYDIDSAYSYLLKGMQERYNDPENIIYKPNVKPVPAYGNKVECKTVDQLKIIWRNSEQLLMEGLTIRERILGSSNPEVPKPVIYRGAVYADAGRFDKCLMLWIHVLRLKQLSKVSVVKDLLRFAQLFSQILNTRHQLDFAYVEEVLESTVLEMDRNCQRIIFPGPKDDVDIVKDDIDATLLTALYLIMITIWFLKDMSKSLRDSGVSSHSFSIGNNSNSKTSELKLTTDKRESRFHQIVYRLVAIGARNRCGQTLLHLAVNPDTVVDDFYTDHFCKFPCALTTKLLIKCGANVNAMDDQRNTPLHLIVPYEKVISDFFTLHNIIMALVEAGAHTDTVNQSGATPIEAATTGVAEVLLRSQHKLNLQCQAARVVKLKGIPYLGHVPVHLVEFIELHGPGHVDVLSASQKDKNVRQQL